MTGNYLTSTFFMLLILSILCVRDSTMITQTISRRSTLFLIILSAAYVLMDGVFIACDLLGGSADAFRTVVFIFYIVYVLLPFAWHMFVRSFVGTNFSRTMRMLECIPVVILLALVLMTPFNGALYTVEADGTYVRGPFFGFYSYLNYFYYLEPLLDAIVINVRKEQEKEPYYRQSLMISLVPLVAAAVNNIVIPVYQIYPFQPFCSVVVAMLAFFFMSSRDTQRLQELHQHELHYALQQAQEASRSKSDFLSRMSHDIRTPMNAILNLTELARGEDDLEQLREYLDKMMISEKFLLGLINDILDVSRIESGSLSLHKENLTRSEFLDTIETVIDPLMEEKELHFHKELRPGEYTISVDKLRFNQIFFNLLSNASKFTPRGGDVWFEVNNMEADDNKLKIQFVVRDNGIGMSEEFLEHLFEPFAQERSELGEKSHGTGLGLPIVKSLVDAMGGSITVKSELGKGTEFAVTLDVDIVAREELAEAKTAKKEKKEIRHGAHVLLVEDNEMNTYVAQIILENGGYTVTTVENGQEALTIFKEQPVGTFDAILMDVRMPVMDGIEATQAIRALDREDAKHIPIIAMTADAFDDERKKTIDAGMDYHMAKPIDATQLYGVLEQCIGQS